MVRIGVFICHCGTNIAGTVDVETVVSEVKDLPGVAYATNILYACADGGQNAIKTAIKEHELNRVVISSCSPRMHEVTFQRCVEIAGLNPYLFEMANIREQCSWVHKKEKDRATEKAIKITKMAIAKARRLEPLTPMTIPVEKHALVIGGGIAGIQAARDISLAGYQVSIVEKLPSIGGRMAQLEKTFPTLDCSA